MIPPTRTVPAGPLIAVVDDDDGVRDSLKMLLESAGFACGTFESGEAFLREFQAREPQGREIGNAAEGQPYACLLLDVRMPGVGGLEVLERLAAAGPSIPVIMMTGHGEVPTAVRAMKAGAVDFVEKPLDGAVLMECIGRALALSERARFDKELSQRASGRIAALTPREREVLEALVAGRPNKVIAHQLGISPRTVEIHRARVMEKMQAQSLSDLVRMSLSTNNSLATNNTLATNGSLAANGSS